MRKFISLLAFAFALLFSGCASGPSSVVIQPTTSFWTGSPVMSMYVLYPEPMMFEFPMADWIVMKMRVLPDMATLVELADIDRYSNSFVKLKIEGQTRPLFESIETDSRIDFNQPSEQVLVALFNYYLARTKAINADKPIKYGPIKVDRKDGDYYAWTVSSNGSYTIAYAVLITKNGNFFTIEINQSNRSTDVEKTMLGILTNHRPYIP